MGLLGDNDLEVSGVVANCRMNRERSLTGTNGYERELRFNPRSLLKELAATTGRARWLDLCCGSGEALSEAAKIVEAEDLPIEIVGVDLVRPFVCSETEHPCLRLVEASLTDWQPDGQFNLITCVHGLHYIGDKLGLIARAASWLTENGRFVANLDMNNIKLRDRQSTGRIVAAALRNNGFTYSSRTRLIQRIGKQQVTFPFRYLGADDNAGPTTRGNLLLIPITSRQAAIHRRRRD